MKYAFRREVLLLVFLALSAEGFCADQERYLAVCRTAADIRSVPEEALAGYGHDDLDETQVLYNEPLLYKGENSGWYQVEAVEQKEFSHNKEWQGYPGWIKKQDACFIEKLPDKNIIVNRSSAQILKEPFPSAEVLLTVCGGTGFETAGEKGRFFKVVLAEGSSGWIAKNRVIKSSPVSNEKKLRRDVIRQAKMFLGTPYLWAGRSYPVPLLKDMALGVDCSGLVNLSFRVAGIDVPRDAHEQWMVSRQISLDELKPADLIFISKNDNFENITHVMISLGGEKFIEAPGTGKKVRISSFKKKFGLKLKDLKAKDLITDSKKIYFGRIIP